jgi:nucleotide-binding universal stress UspA family protein
MGRVMLPSSEVAVAPPPPVEQWRAPAAAAGTAAGTAAAAAPLLVAIHDSPASEDAARFVAALAQRTGAPVEAVTVFEPDVAVGRSGAVRRAWREAMDAHALSAAAAGAWRRVRSAVPVAPHWPLRIETGYAAPVIARVARELGAGLVIVGFDPRDPGERAAGDNLALRLAAFTDVPLLAVARRAPTESGVLPRNALALVEPGDDEPALRVARLARTLLGDTGRLHFATVRPPEALQTGAERLAADRVRCRDCFDTLDAKAGSTAPAAHCRRGCRVVLTGETGPALLGFAAHSGMDLVAAALHGRTRSERTRLPNPAAALLSAAPCSVLLVPEE